MFPIKYRLYRHARPWPKVAGQHKKKKYIYIFCPLDVTNATLHKSHSQLCFLIQFSVEEVQPQLHNAEITLKPEYSHHLVNRLVR